MTGLTRKLYGKYLECTMLFDKLLNGIKSMVANILSYVKWREDEKELFKIKRGVHKDVAPGMRRMGVRFSEDRKGWLLVILYADDQVLCGELEDDLGVMLKRSF